MLFQYVFYHFRSRINCINYYNYNIHYEKITLEERTLLLSRSICAIIAKRLAVRHHSFDLRARFVSLDEGKVKKKKGHRLNYRV